MLQHFRCLIVIYPRPCLRGSCTRIWGRHGDPPNLLGAAGWGNAHATHLVDACPGRPCFSVEAMKQRHQDLFKCCSSMTHCCTSCSTKSLFLQHKTIAFFCMCLFHWLQQMSVFCSTGLWCFCDVLIRFSGQNSREFPNLHFFVIQERFKSSDALEPKWLRAE